jgi:hypothetical protein
LVSNGGYAAFAEDASGRYLTSVRVGKAAAGCTNSASKGGDKLNPLSFMTLLAARRQMAWVGLDLPPGWNVPVPRHATPAQRAYGRVVTPNCPEGTASWWSAGT